MKLEGLAVSRLLILMLIVVAFFAVMAGFFAYSSGPEVGINLEAQCQNTLETNLAASSTSTVKIPNECFNAQDDPVLSSLEGAQPGDSVTKVDGSYRLIQD